MGVKKFKLASLDNAESDSGVPFFGLRAGMIVDWNGTPWIVLAKSGGDLGVFGINNNMESVSAKAAGERFHILGELGLHRVEDFA